MPAKFDLPGAFVLRINGDSMDEARLPARLGGPGGIQPGDQVIMQWVEHREPRHKDIVAAQVLGDGGTLKRYFDAAGEKWLQPESSNPAHQPIALSGDGEPKARVQAVMVGKL